MKIIIIILKIPPSAISFQGIAYLFFLHELEMPTGHFVRVLIKPGSKHVTPNCQQLLSKPRGAQ